MLVLAAADTLAGGASAASQVTCTIFGMELLGTTETYKVLDQRQLAASPATIYTVPASTQTFVRSVHVINNDVVLRTFQLFRGGTAAVNAITPVITLPAGGFAMYEDGAGWQVLNSDGSIRTSDANTATRSVFVFASLMYLGGEQGGTAPHAAGVGSDIGVLPNQVDCVSLVDATDSGAHFRFLMPADAAATTPTIRPLWVPSATDASAHTVAWRMNAKIITSGIDVTAAGTSIAWTGDSAARTANVSVRETGQVTTGVTMTAGDTVRFAVSRDGAAAADSYVGTVQLIGVQIDYTATS